MMEGYQKDFPECPEYVLEVPQGTAVIFSKKVFLYIKLTLHQVWGTGSELSWIPVSKYHIPISCAFVSFVWLLEALPCISLHICSRELYISLMQDSNKRSQLWRQNGEGRLVHIASSEVRGHDMVLDISREAISNSKCELLVVRKKNSHRNSTQIWNFRPVRTG